MLNRAEGVQHFIHWWEIIHKTLLNIVKSVRSFESRIKEHMVFGYKPLFPGVKSCKVDFASPISEGDKIFMSITPITSLTIKPHLD